MRYFILILLFTGLCYADSHTSSVITTTMTTEQIKNFVPNDTGIFIYNSSDTDVYVSTGTTINSWKNARTGNGL